MNVWSYIVYYHMNERSSVFANFFQIKGKLLIIFHKWNIIMLIEYREDEHNA